MKGKFKIAGLFTLLIFGFFTAQSQSAALPKEIIATHLSENCLFPGETLWLKIYVSNHNDLPGKQISNMAFVEFIDNQNTSIIRKKVVLNDGIGNCSITMLDDLPTGIYQVLVYTNWLKNFGEKSFMKSKVLVFNPQSEVTEDAQTSDFSSTDNIITSDAIQTNKLVYKIREKVIVDFDFDNMDFQSANLSISVKQKEPEQIQTLTAKTEVSFENINPKIIQYPDYKGVLFSGRLLNKLNSEPVREQEIILSFPGDFVEIKYANTNQNGEFRFLLAPKPGNTDLVLYLPNNDCMVKLDDPFVNGLEQKPNNIVPEFNITTIKYLKDRYINYQLQKRFKQTNSIEEIEKPESEYSDFFGEPYQSVRIKDYKALDSISEYFYELIPTAHFSNKKGEQQLYLTNPETNFRLGENPIVFIDGVYYPGLNELASLDHNIVEEINVIPKVYYYRDKTYDGIVSVKTKSNNFDNVKQLVNMVRLIYTVSNSYSRFMVPDLDSSNKLQKHIPDLRLLLHWEENIQYEKENPKEVSFYTSDLLGDFIISVVGLTDNGEVINFKKEIKVVSE